MTKPQFIANTAAQLLAARVAFDGNLTTPSVKLVASACIDRAKELADEMEKRTIGPIWKH